MVGFRVKRFGYSLVFQKNERSRPLFTLLVKKDRGMDSVTTRA